MTEFFIGLFKSPSFTTMLIGLFVVYVVIMVILALRWHVGLVKMAILSLMGKLDIESDGALDFLMGRRRFHFPDNLTIVFKQEPNDEPDTQSGQDAAQGSELQEMEDEYERW